MNDLAAYIRDQIWQAIETMNGVPGSRIQVEAQLIAHGIDVDELAEALSVRDYQRAERIIDAVEELAGD